MLLQNIDRPFIRVGTVIVRAAAFFYGKRLFDSGQHIGIVLQVLVVKDKATFP